MPALANIGATDAVPVTRLYKPSRVVNGVATFLDKDLFAGVPNGYSVLSVSHSDPSKTSRNAKTRFKLAIPQLDAEGLVKSTCSVDVTFLCSDTSALLDRQHLVALAASLCFTIGSSIVSPNDSYY